MHKELINKQPDTQKSLKQTYSDHINKNKIRGFLESANFRAKFSYLFFIWRTDLSSTDTAWHT